jgi:hypothetical protein
LTLVAEESDADTMKGGRSGSGGALGLRMQLDRLDLSTQASYFADMHQQQVKVAPAQSHPPLSRSVSAGAIMSVPSLAFPGLNQQPQQQQQQQQHSNMHASLPVRLPGTQFVV